MIMVPSEVQGTVISSLRNHSSPAYPGTYPLEEPLLCGIVGVFRQDQCTLTCNPGRSRLKRLCAAPEARARRLDGDILPGSWCH